MIIVIFEFEINPTEGQNYFDLANELKHELQKIDGFISVSRFVDMETPNIFVSISRWRDQTAIERWHNHSDHIIAQEKGQNSIFKNYRISVASIIRDYTLDDKNLSRTSG